MVQLGQILHRMIHLMTIHYNRGIPFKSTKLVIKDVFQRMTVNDDDTWNFCCVLPTLKDMIYLDDIEIVIPNSLQMEWCKSLSFSA
eukprot:14244709-Ditylum_brightwellii.AAC.1